MIGAKELTPRQIREREEHEVNRLVDCFQHDVNFIEFALGEPRPAPVAPKRDRPAMSAADRRNHFRRAAGWPPLKEQVNDK